MWIEIRDFDIFGKIKKNPQNKKSLNLDQDLRRNHQMNKREFSEKENHKKPKLKLKLTQITIQK